MAKSGNYSTSVALLKFLKDKQPVDKIGMYKYASFESNMKTFFDKLKEKVTKLGGTVEYKLDYVDASEGYVPTALTAMVKNVGPDKKAMNFIFYNNGKVSSWPKALDEAETAADEERKGDAIADEMDKKMSACQQIHAQAKKEYETLLAGIKSDCNGVESTLIYNTTLTPDQKQSMGKVFTKIKQDVATIKTLGEKLKSNLQNAKTAFKSLQEHVPQNEWIGDTDTWTKDNAKLEKDFNNLFTHVQEVWNQARKEAK